MGLSADQLIALIAEPRWGMPVRDMEELLSLGPEAVSALMTFLGDQPLPDPGDVELLWAVVTLGELRDLRAAPVLISVMRNASGWELPVAAAEALAKLGRDVLGALDTLLAEKPDPRTRILVYAALGVMNLPGAWGILERAIETDHDLDFVLARALAERNSGEDQARVYELYTNTEPWKRPVLLDTLEGMISRNPSWASRHKDWRLGYRRSPRQGLQIPFSWPGVMVALWEVRDELAAMNHEPPESWEQIRAKALQRVRQERCPDCGQPLRSPTGIPLCEEVEVDLLEFQLDRVRDWLAARWEDVYEVWDELDCQEMDALHLPEDTDENRRNKFEVLDSLEVVRDTLCWMVEQGCSHLSEGVRLLEIALERARTKAP